MKGGDLGEGGVMNREGMVIQEEGVVIQAESVCMFPVSYLVVLLSHVASLKLILH